LRRGATIALVAPKPPNELGRDDCLHFDLGQVAANMMLTATDLGIGSGHGIVVDQDRARAVLNLPADRFCAT
jgi:hypothetical protein